MSYLPQEPIRVMFIQSNFISCEAIYSFALRAVTMCALRAYSKSLSSIRRICKLE